MNQTNSKQPTTESSVDPSVTTKSPTGSTASTQVQGFTPVLDTFKLAYSRVKSQVMHLLGIEAVQFLMFMIVGIVAVIGFISMLAVNFSSMFGGSEAEVTAAILQSLTDPSTWSTVGIMITIGIFLMLAITSFIFSAFIIRLHNASQEMSFGKVLSMAWSKTPAVFIAMLVTSFISFGASMLLLIPGILVSIFLSAVIYEIVFHDTSLGEGLRNSYTIVKRNFGALFVRWLSAFGLAIVYGILMAVIQEMAQNAPLLYQLISTVMQVFLTWFMYSFAVIVYEQARSITDLSNTSSIAWMYVVSAIGWILFALLLILVLPRINESVLPFIEESIQNEMMDAGNYRTDMTEEEFLLQMQDAMDLDPSLQQGSESMQMISPGEIVTEEGEFNQEEFEAWLQEFEAQNPDLQ